MLKNGLIHKIMMKQKRRPLSSWKNKNIMNFMKNESKGKMITKFAATDPKTCGFRV